MVGYPKSASFHLRVPSAVDASTKLNLILEVFGLQRGKRVTFILSRKASKLVSPDSESILDATVELVTGSFVGIAVFDHPILVILSVRDQRPWLPELEIERKFTSSSTLSLLRDHIVHKDSVF